MAEFFFFRKLAHPINFSFLFKVYLDQYFRIVFTVIFKFQIIKEVNLHNNTQKIISKKVLQKTCNIFCHIKFLLQQ